jgi:vacuolar protein sorting-associated protein 35
VQLFVDLLEHYLYFFEKKNPFISHNYISGLVALIKEHFSNLISFDGDSRVVADAKGQFQEVVRYIKKKKSEESTAALFAEVQIEGSDV